MKLLKVPSSIQLSLLVAVFVSLFSSSVLAATFNLDAGEFKFTGDTYIDITSPTETKAVGRVATITQGSDVIWTSGDGGKYLNFTAEGITPVISPTAPIFNFLGTGGSVDFLTTTSASLFDVSLNWLTLSTAIKSGDLYLQTLIHGDVTGIATPVSYSTNGFLDVIGGSDAALFDTNSRPTFVPNDFADISFGLSGSNNLNPNVHNDYFYITSSDSQGAVANVDEPSPMWLIGLGSIYGVGSGIRRKSISPACA